MATSTISFRFLDLPREIRDEVYNYALCTFSRFDTYTIDHYARVHAQSLFNQRRFLGTINLLLTNKQIHHEGNEYMLNKNLFTRVECCGFNVRDYFHGHTPGILILAINKNPEPSPVTRLEKFPWYAMHIWMGIDRVANGTRKRGRKAYKDMIMLWEDLGEFYRRFEVESATKSQSNPERDPLRIVVRLNPFAKEQEKGMQVNGLPTSFFSRHVQEKLLQPIKEGLRYFPNLKIEGCTEDDLVSQVTEALAKPLWPDFESIRTELAKHNSDATGAWAQGHIMRCIQSCTAGISLILRLRASPLSLHFLQHKTSDLQATLSQHYFNFHFLSARCLHRHLSAPPDNRVFPKEAIHMTATCTALISMLSYCDMPRVPSHAQWHPTNRQKAEVYYLTSLAKRLQYEWVLYARQYNHQDITTFIVEAVDLWPDNEVYIQEKGKVERWLVVRRKFEFWEAQREESGGGLLGGQYLLPGVQSMMDWRKEFGEWEGT